MMKIVKFIVITMLVTAVQGVYFKYLLSRDVSEWILYPATLLAIAIFLLYLWYAVKQLNKLLKIE